MSNADDVLSTYNLPSFDSILSEDFRNRFGLLQAHQYGIACTNVQAECAEAQAFGSGPFLPAKLKAPNWVQDGEPRRGCKIDFALGYAGEHQIEFLGPGQGTTFYSDALQGQDHVLHHIGIYQNGSREIEAKLNRAGIRTSVTGGVCIGKLLAFEFKYFDTRDEIGCYLELLDFRVLDSKQIPVDATVKQLARLHSFLFR